MAAPRADLAPPGWLGPTILVGVALLTLAGAFGLGLLVGHC